MSMVPHYIVIVRAVLTCTVYAFLKLTLPGDFLARTQEKLFLKEDCESKNRDNMNKTEAKNRL